MTTPVQQPPAAPPGNAPKPAPGREPAPELVAHFTDPRTRARLLGNLRWKFVPERRREDIVQTTLESAWKQRHAWPKTTEELDKLLLTMLRCDRIDDRRKESHAPLDKKPVNPKASSDETADASYADEDQETPATTTTVDPLEARDGVKVALDYAASRPRLKHPMKWLMQSWMGMTYAEIAAADGVTEKIVKNQIFRLREELRKALGPVAICLAIVGIAALIVALIHFLRVGRVNDQAHPPRPVPTVVAPPTAPDPSPATAAPTSPTSSASLKPHTPQ